MRTRARPWDERTIRPDLPAKLSDAERHQLVTARLRLEFLRLSAAFVDSPSDERLNHVIGAGHALLEANSE